MAAKSGGVERLANGDCRLFVTHLRLRTTERNGVLPQCWRAGQRGNARLDPQPDRGAEHEDVGSEDALLDAWPLIALAVLLPVSCTIPMPMK